MMKFLPSIAISILVILLVYGIGSYHEARPPENSPNFETKRSGARLSREESTLAKVRAAAQRKLPNIQLVGRENTVFAALGKDIDELDVMEVLLSVESEFDMEIPDSAITGRIGQEHRRDLLNHLSLSDLAQVVGELRREPAP